MTNSHSCDDNAMCINTVGGFHCMCNMGYTGIGTEDNCTSKVYAVQNWSSVIHPAVIPAQLMGLVLAKTNLLLWVTLHNI